MVGIYLCFIIPPPIVFRTIISYNASVSQLAKVNDNNKIFLLTLGLYREYSVKLIGANTHSIPIGAPGTLQGCFYYHHSFYKFKKKKRFKIK